jgi:hypothetical protein
MVEIWCNGGSFNGLREMMGVKEANENYFFGFIKNLIF